jgi:hypothetical protein
VQARIALARGQKRVCEQIDALLLGQAPGIQDVDVDGEQAWRAQLGVKPADVGSWTENCPANCRTP